MSDSPATTDPVPADPRALVQRIAAHGLTPGPASPGPSGDPGAPVGQHTTGEPESWARVVALAEEQRVLGLLGAAVLAGDVRAPSDEPRLGELVEAWCVHDLRLERLLGRAADALDDAGVRFLVVKGPAVAHRWYRSPGLRLFADLDLVVPSGEVHRATAVLHEALGTDAELPELRPGFDERFGKESLLRTPTTTSTPLGLELDLHRTLVAGALGLAIPLDELFEQTETVAVGGRHIPTLGPVPTLLLACFQASIADVPPRLGAARDLAQMVRSGRIEVEAVAAAARRWRATAAVRAALRWSWDVLELPDRPPLLRWADAVRPRATERLLLAAHVAPGHVYWRQLAAVAVLPGVEARLAYLTAVLAPQRDYLDRRRWSLLGHLHTGWRVLSRPLREPVVRSVRRFRARWWPPA